MGYHLAAKQDGGTSSWGPHLVPTALLLEAFFMFNFIPSCLDLFALKLPS